MAWKKHRWGWDEQTATTRCTVCGCARWHAPLVCVVVDPAKPFSKNIPTA